jgi:hypothetical protein
LEYKKGTLAHDVSRFVKWTQFGMVAVVREAAEGMREDMAAQNGQQF